MLILLIKNIHSKQAKKIFAAIVFHLVGVYQFLNEDTVGGYTGIFEFREVTRQSLGLGAGEPRARSRFIKNGKSVVDGLLARYLPDSATFQRIIGAGSNAMATDQSCYALVS